MLEMVKARSGALVTPVQALLLAGNDEYRRVREFKNEVFSLSLFWGLDEDTGVPWFLLYELGIQTIPIADEVEALNRYEDRLVSENCGEWFAREDGTHAFMEIGNFLTRTTPARSAEVLEYGILGLSMFDGAPPESYGTW